LKEIVIAAIVPAHNEEHHIRNCLIALRAASRCPRLCGEQTVVIVVVDACTDRTRSIARGLGATTIALSDRNVGAARALGAELALAAGARWLAFTDADTQVAPDWISAQLAQRKDVVCGTVAVRDWGTYGNTMRDHYDSTYNDADGHRHVHGANLGVSAHAYEQAGGFQALRSSEDVALVESLKANGASIAWRATCISRA
jgi:glycosyltransferase involved in cell wall biosynthesis